MKKSWQSYKVAEVDRSSAINYPLSIIHYSYQCSPY